MASVMTFWRAASIFVMVKTSSGRGQQPRGCSLKFDPQASHAADQEDRQAGQQDVENKHSDGVQDLIQAQNPKEKTDGGGQVEQEERYLHRTGRHLRGA